MRYRNGTGTGFGRIYSPLNVVFGNDSYFIFEFKLDIEYCFSARRFRYEKFSNDLQDKEDVYGLYILHTKHR
jgi:hypothetical protein